MPRSVGLDITETAVRAVELESSGRRLRVLRYAEQALRQSEGRSWTDAAADGLVALFAENRIPREGVTAALDAGDLLFRPLNLPFRTDDQIRKVVKYELESQLQNYSADDLVVDHVVSERTEKGSQLLAIAAPKEVVRARLALLERAAIDTAALDLDANAIANAYARGHEGTEEPPFIVAHGGPRFTRLVLIHHGAPRFVRALRFALESAPAPTEPNAPARPDMSADSSDAAPPGAKAEAPSETKADPPAVASLDAKADLSAVAPQGAKAEARAILLAREISRFLLSSQATESPARIILSGTLAGRPALARRLSTETGLPVSEGELLEGVEHAFGDAGAPAHLAVPLGLALKGLGHARTRLDFRQEEFVHQRPYERVRRTLASAVFLSALLFLLAAVHLHLQKDGLRGQLDLVLDKQQQVMARVYPERAASIEDRETLLEEMKREWRKEEEKRGGGSGTSLPSALEPVGAVFNAMRELLARQTAGGRNADFHIALESLNYTITPKKEGRLEFTGRISSPTLAEALQNALKAVKSFAPVSLEGLSARPDEKYNFTMKIGVNASASK